MKRLRQNTKKHKHIGETRENTGLPEKVSQCRVMNISN